MWFTETPWPPILALCMLGALLVVVSQAKQRAIYLWSVAPLAVLAVGIYFVERMIVTESERVEAAVFGLCHAFQRDDLEGTLEFFSPENTQDRATVERAIHMVTVEDDLRVTDVEIDLTSDGTRAVSHFRANATISVKNFGSPQRFSSRWELTWRREEDEWRIIRIQRLDPITGAVIDHFSSGR